ncbi:hypothetical protein [Pseudomonas paralcaligenes]|uniref:hypothetical protein n=1 Tax=Pseudomonas paralcaligenes TaxID=2772558 RepID=UPI001C81A729|nr:hypothetical protein [Pseudomonas paralcaligenes]
MVRFFVSSSLILAISLSFSAYAENTYTPEQLRKMVNSGHPPEQGSPTTQTQAVSFGLCVAKVNEVLAAVKEQYPVKVIVQTEALHVTKVWTNDAAMMLSCSQPDRKLVITSSKYL